MELGLPPAGGAPQLKKRTEVPELSNFVLTLTQADALGMPVGRVPKASAGEMRSKRQQSIFVALLGPAASDIGSAFGG